eukprot:TRINITY_DN74685_c0_g1_i1.p1 TRINITY_DN74685_c0_g1~~TRINITY_DN74685_c0_g1_i1.p1  ORF type:complete len:167 (-),score=12.46 TRINITY_DN74685_c0_g1_i1:248-748(-)
MALEDNASSNRTILLPQVASDDKGEPPTSFLVAFLLFLLAMCVLTCFLVMVWKLIGRTEDSALDSWESFWLQPNVRETATVTKPVIVGRLNLQESFPAYAVEGEPVCIICLQPILVSEKACKLQCDHVFHSHCVFKWWLHRAERVPECLVCRMPQTIQPGSPQLCD